MPPSILNLKNRIYNYLNVEHNAQKKDNFHLLAVLQFKNKQSVKKAEDFIKICNCSNIFIDQPSSLEQYQLRPFWDQIEQFLNKFPFCIKSYINPDA